MKNIESFEEFSKNESVGKKIMAGILATSLALPIAKKMRDSDEKSKEGDKKEISATEKEEKDSEKVVKYSDIEKEKEAKRVEEEKKEKKDVKKRDDIETKPPKKFYKLDGLPKNFDKVPGDDNIYRSNQPSLKQLEKMITHYKIKRVIRMNAKEDTNVTPDQERKLVESLGAEYYYVNAHKGYKKGKGYVKSLDEIQPLLKKGDALIHCTHGADRTGYQVGKYLMDKLGWSRKKVWNYTIKYNNWEKYIPNGNQEYIKYLEGFYPYDLWKEEIGPQYKKKN